MGLGVGFATLFISSAIYGYVNTSACSKRRQGPSAPADTPDADDGPAPEMSTTSPARSEPAATRM